MVEDTATDNEIFRGVELEQKQFTGAYRTGVSGTAWLPEIDFIGLLGAEQVEPIAISNSNKHAYHVPVPFSRL